MPPVNRIVVLLVLVLLPLAICSTPTMRTKGDDLLIKVPVVEKFDLLVDGSNTLQHFTPNETFTYIERGIWSLHFTDNAIDYDLWGSGPALTNGTAMFYDTSSLLPANITDIHEIAHSCYDFSINRDEKNPKDNHIAARYSFFKFVPPGLFMPEHTFTVIVQDNQTAAANDIDEFILTLQGYTFEQDRAPEERNEDWFRQAFGEKALVFPSPLYAFGLLLLFVAAFWAFYRKFIK